MKRREKARLPHVEPKPTRRQSRSEDNNKNVDVTVKESDEQESPKIDSTASVDWRTQFGFMNDVDKVYRKFPCSKKPRMPTQEDSTSWIESMLPTDEFLNNPAAIQDLENLCEPSEKYKNGTNVVVAGQLLSGKTSFIQLFIKRNYPEPEERKRRLLLLDASTMEEKTMLAKMESLKRYIEHPKTKPHTRHPYVVIENFQVLNPRIQQHSIGPLWDALNEAKIFFVIAVSPDANKLTDQIKTSSKIIRLQALQEIHVLEKLLTICVKERIGFVRPAIDYILRRKKHDLGKCLDALQHIFQTYQNLSMENVNRFFRRTLQMKETLQIIEMCAPLSRCKVCTLVPPCAHTTLQHLYDRVLRLRSLYPQDNQREICPDFKHTGICHVFNRKGRCMFDHPLDIHVIDTSKLGARCTIHTLPLPCTHCKTLEASKQQEKSLDKEKNRLLDQMDQFKKELARVESSLHAHRKAHADSIIWGKAKEKFLATCTEMENEMKRLRCNIDQQTKERIELDQTLASLHEKNERGYCKGLGKGMHIQEGVDAPASWDDNEV
ncbi:hypothetical protein Ae201684_000876 [Aphanomyces euteiches]|uniref:Uncharacterized protein n=1 Tax=Aphanomyces euteiches TaxID=100861 RepID=A0A6G0XUP6_9STRA|nr:hypothetical protein Ae201684_000876 [Aphanomyces euteiches]